LKQAENYRSISVLPWSAFGGNIGWLAADIGRQAGIEFVQEKRLEGATDVEACIRSCASRGAKRKQEGLAD
jgi:hypothetical protein